MAEPIDLDPMVEVEVDAVDVEMGGADIPETDTGATAENENENENDLPFAGEEEEVVQKPTRVTFVDYLKSPIVSLIVGEGEEKTELMAHQGLLVQSPWFGEECGRFGEGVRVSLFPNIPLSIFVI